MKSLKKISWSLSWGVVCLLALPRAASAFELSVLGTASLSRYQLQPAPTSQTSGAGFGLGVLAATDLTPALSLESGALFFNHFFSYVSDSNVVHVQTGLVKIPLWLSVSPMEMLAVKVGPYFAIAESASPGSLSSDYGFHVGGSLLLPLAPESRFRFDLLYEYGLASLSAANLTTQNSRNILILAGIDISFF